MKPDKQEIRIKGNCVDLESKAESGNKFLVGKADIELSYEDLAKQLKEQNYTIVPNDKVIWVAENAKNEVESILKSEKECICDMCGGKLVYIRGKNPGEEDRLVCPACSVERLEQIEVIADRNYGRDRATKRTNQC